ncbi:hypothetical protein B0O99DRAFT_745746 [Bisporella sp. PMI_857]|nr:hypothetical protein B0O99DRAFT_745746 [Bisporella sp. PMI_857]
MKDGGYANDGGNSLTLPFTKDTESKDPPGITVSRQKLKIIPNPSGMPDGIPLVAHQPAKRSQIPIPEATEGTEAPPPTSSFASNPSIIQPIPTKPEITAKVLHDFKDGDTDELAIREKLEREFDEFILKESQGLLVGESRRRHAWVPASYFNDLSPTPTAVGSSVETATSNARPERARKRPSLPKLSVLDETPSTEEGVSFLETTQMDSTPSTPLPLLNRKFSWESKAKEENITVVPLQIDPQPAPLPQISSLPRKFSWSSDGSDQQPSTPDLIRSSSSSSSFNSSTSSTLSASTTLTGLILKFDPVIKDLIVAGSENTSFLAGTHNPDDFLENLSKSTPE